jgi:hypothetical protein
MAARTVSTSLAALITITSVSAAARSSRSTETPSVSGR